MIGLSPPRLDAIPADPRDVAHRRQEAWQRYLAALGGERLAILAVEDIHWASTALLDLVEQLAENLANASVLILCTARPELLERRPAWGAGKANATSLTLAPLLPDEAARLVSALLGEISVPEDVERRLLTHAEGNPFFLEEMLHMLIDERGLEQQGGAWVATERLADMAIPDSVHGAIAARIDLLEAHPREALRRCSVVGRVFWPAAVGVDEEVIASLARRGLVSDRQESIMGGMREFAFRHALTRDVAYSSLPRVERRDLHRRVADWIQHVVPGRESEMAELVAYHLVQAIEYGDDDPAVARRASDLLLAAGEASLAQAALAAASTQLEHALELADDDHRRAVAQLALARLDETEARHESALERLDLLEKLLGQDDVGLRADALGLRSRVCWLTGRWQEALSSANSAVAAIAGGPETRQLARALARRSQIEMLTSRPEASEHAAEALAVARRVGDPFAEVNAQINLSTAQAMNGVAPDPQELGAVVSVAIEAGLYEEANRAMINFVWSATGFVPVGRIERVVEEARGLLGGVPAPETVGSYLELSIVMHLLVPAGRWAEADAVVAGIDAPRLTATSRLVWLTLVAGLALRRGDLVTIGPLLDELRPLALESDEPQRIIPMACVVLPALLLAGAHDELRSAADEILAAVDDRWSDVLGTVPMVRALALAGEEDLLARTTESLRRVVGGRTAGKIQTFADRGRGGAGARARTVSRGGRAPDGGSREGARAGLHLRGCLPRARPRPRARIGRRPGRRNGSAHPRAVGPRPDRLREPVLNPRTSAGPSGPRRFGRGADEPGNVSAGSRRRRALSSPVSSPTPRPPRRDRRRSSRSRAARLAPSSREGYGGGSARSLSHSPRPPPEYGATPVCPRRQAGFTPRGAQEPLTARLAPWALPAPTLVDDAPDVKTFDPSPKALTSEIDPLTPNAVQDLEPAPACQRCESRPDLIGVISDHSGIDAAVEVSGDARPRELVDGVALPTAHAKRGARPVRNLEFTQVTDSLGAKLADRGSIITNTVDQDWCNPVQVPR